MLRHRLRWRKDKIMNKIVLNHEGLLQINGADVGVVSGIRMKADENGCTKVTVQFDVDAFDIEFSAEDFRINHLPLRAASS